MKCLSTLVFSEVILQKQERLLEQVEKVRTQSNWDLGTYLNEPLYVLTGPACTLYKCTVCSGGPGDSSWWRNLSRPRIQTGEETSWVHQGQEFELELEAKERRWATAKTRREIKRSIRSQRSASRKAGYNRDTECRQECSKNETLETETKGNIVIESLGDLVVGFRGKLGDFSR